MSFYNKDISGKNTALGQIFYQHPRKIVFYLVLVLSGFNLVVCAWWLLTELTMISAVKLYLGYFCFLLLLLCANRLTSRIKWVAIQLMILSGAINFHLVMLAYYFSKGLGAGDYVYYSAGVCFLVFVLSAFTLQSSKRQTYQIYISLNRLIELGFIDPKKHELTWSHALLAYPSLGPYPREIPALSEKELNMMGIFALIGVYGSIIGSVLVAILSDMAILGFLVFVLAFLSFGYGQGFWKTLFIFRIVGKYKKRYGEDLVLPA